MKLRYYQIKAINQIKEKLKQGHKRILAVLPTGSGKSIIMGFIAKMCTDKGSKVLALMHRRGLVHQLGDRFESCGVESGKIMSQIKPELSNDVQIGTIQTYSKRIEIVNSDWDDNTFRPWEHKADLILTDESHRSLSKTFQDTLKYYSDKIVIGFTATPVLSSGVGMGNYYSAIVQPVGVQELINTGSLVPGEYFGLSAPDLSGLKIVKNDYEQGELGKRFSTPKLIGDVVKNWNDKAFGMKTLVFAMNVKHSQALVYEFCKLGVAAEHLDSKSDDEKREETLKRFRSGETTILSNVGLFTEGTDIPEIECMCIAVSTKNIGKWLQMIGRGARPYPGKKSFYVFDHGKNINEHGFYEDPIIWTLDGKKLSYKKPSPVEPKEKHKMNCKNCNRVFTGDTCPGCGTVIEHYGKKIEAIEADLKRLTQKKEKETKGHEFKRLKPAVLIGMLVSEAKRLNKKDSWVRANYKNITTHWPKTLDVRPLPATKELKSYLTYLRIKWIKSQKGK